MDNYDPNLDVRVIINGKDAAGVPQGGRVMIGSMWENMHTKRIAKVLSEPISGVFELMYEDREGQPEYYQTSLIGGLCMNYIGIGGKLDA